MDRPGRPADSASQVVLAAGGVRVLVDPADGGRMTSLAIGGVEVLAARGSGVIDHGSFVMAPWAGRIRDGLLRVGAAEHRLPTDRTHPHAGHGLVMDRSWRVLSSDPNRLVMRCDLDHRWPFAGHVLHELRLAPDRLTQRIELHAEEVEFPATVGWHPWFPRRLAGVPARLALVAEGLLVRDSAGIPSGEVVAIPPGPWDDCFVGPQWPITITWPGVLSLQIDSDVGFAVVYDELDVAFCVEPQSGPPDGPNTTPRMVRPGEPLVASTVWAWT